MVIAAILSFQVPYHYRVISGIMQFIRARQEIQLWLPNTNIVSQAPAEAVDVGIGTREKQVAEFLPAAAKTVIVSSCPQPDRIQVCVDNTVLSQMALAHFRSRKVGHFAYLHDKLFPVSVPRLAAFEACCRDAGFPLHVLSATNFRDSAPDPGLVEELTALPKPAGLLLPSDSFGPKLLEVCRTNDLRIPEDLLVLGVNDHAETCLSCSPTLSSIDISAEKIGYEAARIAVEMVSGREVAAITRIPPCQVIRRESTDFRRSIRPEVMKLLDFMHRNLSRKVEMADLLAEQPLARRALERAFKEDMGESPMRYLQFLRLQQVRYLLTTTDLTVTEIGRRCGIPDVNYLCRVFRNLFDQTPGRYRQQNRRKPETKQL